LPFIAALMKISQTFNDSTQHFGRSRGKTARQKPDIFFCSKDRFLLAARDGT
jgi:hypothetical protein